VSQRQPSKAPQIPGFTYVDLLGMGGFADVFRYWDDRLQREVAIKVLPRTTSAAMHRSFQDEANLMAKLSNHPSIVTVFEGDITKDGRPFLVMELCPPPHLGMQLRRKPISVAKALLIGVEIAGAVQTAHLAHVLHRDIKPANILFTEYKRPALTDFGIAASTQSGGVGANGGVSIPWAPPEQLRGAEMGPSGDVYSLAATIFHMLTARSPFTIINGANDNLSLSSRIKSAEVPRTGRDDVPESLERVLRRAMDKSPERRYQSATEFAAALNAVEMELHLSPTPILVRNDKAVLDPASDGDDDDAGDSGTELASFVPIDPDGPGYTFTTGPDENSASPATLNREQSGDLSDSGMLAHGRGRATWQGPLEWTGAASGTGADDEVDDTQLPSPPPEPTVVGSGSAPPEPAEKPDRRGRVVAIGVAAVAAAVVAGIIGVSTSGKTPAKGTSSRSTAPPVGVKPVDPIGATVPKPGDLTVTRSGGRVTVSWSNPDPRAGDEYLYRIVDPVSPKDYASTKQTRVSVPAQSGRTCIDVILRRSNGHASTSAVGCA